VTVTAGRTTSLDVNFSDASMQMKEFVVKGQAIEMAQGLNRQKNEGIG
jgi:hypothetical protein